MQTSAGKAPLDALYSNCDPGSLLMQKRRTRACQEAPVGAEAPEGCAHEEAIQHCEGEPHSVVAWISPIADGALARQHAVLPEQALRVLGIESQALGARLRLTQPVHQPTDIPGHIKQF